MNLDSHFDVLHAATLSQQSLQAMQEYAAQRRLARQLDRPEESHKRFMFLFRLRRFLYRWAPRAAARWIA